MQCLQNNIFPSDFLIKIVYTLLISVVRAKVPSFSHETLS